MMLKNKSEKFFSIKTILAARNFKLNELQVLYFALFKK